MAPHCRKATHSKAEEDATCKANITAAVKAVRENWAKNLLAAAGQFNVPYHTLRQCAQNLTKPHSKAYKYQQLLYSTLPVLAGAISITMLILLN
jgi:hypothetical protein